MDQAATVGRVLTIMLNYVYSGRTEAWEALTEPWLPSDQAQVRSLSVEPRASDWQALAEKPPRPRGHSGSCNHRRAFDLPQVEVLTFATGHGPGQERLCSEE
jgi:hypothetical protein